MFQIVVGNGERNPTGSTCSRKEAMTSKETVLSVYPDAHEVHEDDGWWRIFTNAGPSASALSARRRYRVDAWHDAASKIGTPSSLATREQVRTLGMRLRDTANSRNDGPSDIWYWHSLAEQALMYASKLPPSPAEETASEPVRKVLTRADIAKMNEGNHRCGWTTGAVKNPNPACGCMCGTVYAPDGNPILSHGERHSGVRCKHADERGRLIALPEPEFIETNSPSQMSADALDAGATSELIRNPKWLPEPVSPEGAAESMCQSRSSAGYQCIQSVAGHRKYHSTVAAPIEESNGGVFWCDDPAAPIAPAADEFYIQDTRDYVGNSVLWWRVNGNGYTTNLDEAWKVPGTWNGRPSDKLWPCAEVDARTTRQFDMQLFREIRKGAKNV